MERVCNYSEARRNLKSLMDTVVEDRVTVVITRKAGEPVIMMGKSEHDAMMETFHLLRSPRNAERLHASIAEIDNGDVVHAELLGETYEEKR